MKLLLLFLLMAAGNTVLAQNKIDGTWKGTRETPNGNIEITYEFKVDGTTLNGMLKTQYGEVKVDNGKVEGKKFSYSITFNETTINSTGELVNDDEILIKNERGEMKLTRVKA